MLCIRPFRSRGGEFGCAKCTPCKINRRRLWKGRILLESFQHDRNLFVTLTAAGRYESLSPVDLKLFIMRLRTGLGRKFRYFAVGEYGERSGRPHYHLALFGVGMEDRLEIESAWRYGFIHLGDLNEFTAEYICGYVVKKMTAKDDERLEGRYPEFARMSRGLGKGAVEGLAAGLLSSGGSKALVKAADVPSTMKIQGREFPLGRYLRRKLREAVGWSSDMPLEAKERLKAKIEAEDPVVREVHRERQYEEAVQRSQRLKLRRRV